MLFAARTALPPRGEFSLAQPAGKLPWPRACLTRLSTLPELRAHYGERYRWLLLFLVMVGWVAAIMSSMIVNVAVPDMSRYFVVGQHRAQWMSSGFMVAMTVSMLTTPWLLGRFGYRRTYAGTMWVLLAGGVVGGFSNDVSRVLAARVAEGLAAFNESFLMLAARRLLALLAAWQLRANDSVDKP